MDPSPALRRDPVCGMPGVLERHGHWFCSERCAQIYAGRGGAGPRSRARLTDPWVWVPVTGLVLALLGTWWGAAASVSGIYRSYVAKVGLPLLLGLFLGGVIDHYVPKEYIVRWLTGPRKRVIVRSAFLGFLASACSHGCLALSLELHRKGASVPAVISFLLASPWANLSLTLILLGLFGVRGLILIAGAFVIALLAGWLFQRLERAGKLEPNPHQIDLPAGFSFRRDLVARWRAIHWTPTRVREDARGILRGVVPLGRMVLGWVQFGLIVSALLGGLVPHHLFETYLGPTVGGLFATLAVATILEVCSEGTAPLAFEIYRNTRALGNSFAFLMGGVVTDYTELGALWKAIGPRTVAWLLAITLPLVVLGGLILNAVG